MIDIQRKSVKNFTLRVSHTGKFKVTVPRRASEFQIADFINKNSPWIYKQEQTFKNLYNSLPPLEISEGLSFLYMGEFLTITANPAIEREGFIYLPKKNLKQYLKIKLKAHLEMRLDHYSQKYGFNYNQLRVKDISSNWGSCSGKNNLNFNYHLVFVQRSLIDYLVVHELAHLHHKNHSKRYWQDVAKMMPDYQIRQKYLKKLSNLIFCWGEKLNAGEKELTYRDSLVYQRN